MSFKFIRNKEIPELICIEPDAYYDERGFFLESYKKNDYLKAGIALEFVQDNHSLSKKGVIRGFHYQVPPKAQGKLVRIIKGAVIDFAVDIRRSSPTFLKWISIELSEDNNRLFYIPPGFAHGFISQADETHLVYKCTEEYAPDYEHGIRWDDPDIGILWGRGDFYVNAKDRNLPRFKEAVLFD